jgi:hypothetical protein
MGFDGRQRIIEDILWCEAELHHLTTAWTPPFFAPWMREKTEAIAIKNDFSGRTKGNADLTFVIAGNGASSDKSETGRSVIRCRGVYRPWHPTRRCCYGESHSSIRTHAIPFAPGRPTQMARIADLAR